MEAQHKRTNSVSAKSSAYEINSPKHCISTAISSVDKPLQVESASNYPQNSLYTLPSVTRHSSTSSSIESYPTIPSEPDISQQLSSSLLNGLPLNLLSSEYHHSDTLFQENNKLHHKQNNELITATTYHLDSAKYRKGNMKIVITVN
jgi:hypothetical protein